MRWRRFCLEVRSLGQLPVSLPKKFEDSPAAANYPGKDLHATYAEGLYVGYRYYDRRTWSRSSLLASGSATQRSNTVI